MRSVILTCILHNYSTKQAHCNGNSFFWKSWFCRNSFENALNVKWLGGGRGRVIHIVGINWKCIHISCVFLVFNCCAHFWGNWRFSDLLLEFCFIQYFYIMCIFNFYKQALVNFSFIIQMYNAFTFYLIVTYLLNNRQGFNYTEYTTTRTKHASRTLYNLMLCSQILSCTC